MAKYTFPKGFQFGTSTAVYQVETAFQHDWEGVKSRDGHTFEITTDHEKHLDADVALIAAAAPYYRLSLMWSRLQRRPYAELDQSTVTEYHQLLQSLRNRNVSLMMVIHHFTNPSWFKALGGWERKENIFAWIDFAKKLAVEFGGYISSWNTFNEPNLYTSMGWVMGEFPPFKNNIYKAWQVIRHMGEAHEHIYRYLKEKYPHHQVGLSLNSAVLHAENLMGKIPASLVDYCFMEYPPSLFPSCDFFGMSYYARIGFDPFPVSMLTSPRKLEQSGKLHDDMWEYYPNGLRECILRYWNRFGKPIIVTENGVCTADDEFRIRAIHDYLKIIHDLIRDGVPVQGYYHWSTWDNFEWSLGPTYQFGLYEVNRKTMERKSKRSAHVYSAIAYSNSMEI